MLTETLRRAERDGLIARHLDDARIETATLYELTDLGRSLDQPLAALAQWAEVNWKAVEVAREQWDARRQASGGRSDSQARLGRGRRVRRYAWWGSRRR